MSEDQARRQELVNKFPDVDQHFQAIKGEIYEPQVERLGETKQEQKERAKKPT